jgi:hypothetical protein
LLVIAGYIIERRPQKATRIVARLWRRPQRDSKEAIAALLESLFKIERYFMQMTHSGVITLAGDSATARFVIREHGRGDTTYYDNLGVYNDVLVREPGGWRFLKRHYRYRFLDQVPFAGDAFPIDH